MTGKKPAPDTLPPVEAYRWFASWGTEAAIVVAATKADAVAVVLGRHHARRHGSRTVDRSFGGFDTNRVTARRATERDLVVFAAAGVEA